MVNGSESYHAESDSLLDHGRYIVLSLPVVGISTDYHADVRGARHSARLSLDTPSCVSFRQQGPSGVFFDYLDTSNISTDSREARCPSYRFTLPRILIPVALRG